MAGAAVQDAVVRALVLYALAEHQAGHASRIAVRVEGDAFEVEDDGRGHAIGRELAGASYLRLIYQQFDDLAEGEGAWPVQLQGLGLSLINRLCTELRVTVRRPPRCLSLVFAHGVRIGHAVHDAPDDNRHGNLLAGRLDGERRGADAEAPGLDGPRLHAWLQALAQAHPGLSLHFNGQRLAAAQAGGAPA